MLGWLYKGYDGSDTPIYSQIFPKRGLLYDSPMDTSYEIQKMKKVYNISSPAVTSKLTVPS
jgi:hypothetical protein